MAKAEHKRRKMFVEQMHRMRQPQYLEFSELAIRHTKGRPKANCTKKDPPCWSIQRRFTHLLQGILECLIKIGRKRLLHHQVQTL